MKKFHMVLLVICILSLGITSNALASYITGGDASSQADADSILDIVFVSDTSGSMSDEMTTISNTMNSIITNLNCPDIDMWVRASLMGITGTYYGTLFDETVSGLVTSQSGTPVSNHVEDNGPAVTDLVNWYNWNNDAIAGQEYYKAVVTIGDEGTENGWGVDQADWDAAFVANQAAKANDVMVFSLLGTPYYGQSDELESVFEVMAVGGTGGSYDTEGYVFDNTGGTFGMTTSDTLEIDIERIICTAASGGTTNNNPVPEPMTMLLFGPALLGLVGLKKKRA